MKLHLKVERVYFSTHNFKGFTVGEKKVITGNDQIVEKVVQRREICKRINILNKEL